MGIKKELIILFYLLFVVHVMRAQESSLYIGPAYSIGFGSAEFVQNSTSSGNPEFTGTFNQDLGVSFYYSSDGNWGMETGMFFSISKYKATYNFSAIAPNDPAIPVETTVKENYVSIPIKVLYSFVQEKSFQLFAQTGFNGAYLLGLNEQTIYGASNEEKSNYFVDYSGFFSLSWLVGLSMDFKAEKVVFRIVPEVSKSLVKNENSMISNAPWNLGIQGKILFKL
jgi:hypothetical protein